MSNFGDLRKYVKEKRVEKYHRIKVYLTEKNIFKEIINESWEKFAFAGICILGIISGRYLGCVDEAHSANHKNSNKNYQMERPNYNSAYTDTLNADTTKHIKSLDDKIE